MESFLDKSGLAEGSAVAAAPPEAGCLVLGFVDLDLVQSTCSTLGTLNEEGRVLHLLELRRVL